MSEPLVVAVMLTRDRPEMTARAIRSFLAQTYKNKKLLVWDNSTDLICCDQLENDGVVHVPAEPLPTIGQLRNAANGFWTEYDIVCHFDSDDVSHPRRIEEQVALLVASRKECVGYNEMVFWQEPGMEAAPGQCRNIDGNWWHEPGSCNACAGKAWLFQNKSPNYAIGTSLCYWRSTWEKHPFPDKMRGEDYDFVYGCDSAGCTSMPTDSARMIEDEDHPWVKQSLEPRMIASIHAGNGVRVDQRAPHHWTRATGFDEFCREKMAL